jgi:hypothetical protein
VAQGVAFLVVASILCLLALLALGGSGVIRLESRLGVMRDGPRLDSRAPRWTLPDVDGRRRSSAAGTWQLLVFADHSLIEFPGVLAGIERLRSEADLEIFLVSRRAPELVEATARALKLGVPAIPVDEAFYHRFNVRLMPFAVLTDRQGIVREKGVVNHEETLLAKWRTARARVLEREGSSSAGELASRR